MSRALANAAILAGGLVLAPISALAGEPHGDDARGWYDSSDPGGYHVTARRGGRRESSGTDRNPDATTVKRPSPTHCVEAAEGLYVAAPVGFIAGKPVVCGADDDGGMTPQRLAAQAWDVLRVPTPDVHTAPPRGTAGLVGLAEWLWIPRSQWRPLSRQVATAGVWARVTATPRQLRFDPGDGSAEETCDGPGAAFDQRRPAARQRTDCSHTFTRASTPLPGAVYRVRVSLVWTGSWIGSGGVGGVLPQITRSVTFSLRVGEAQGLYG